MSRCFPRTGLPLLLLALLPAQACERDSSTATTEPTALTGNQTVFKAEPVPLRAEFLPGESCRSTRPFGTRVIITVTGGTGVFVRGFHFRFSDRAGTVALPRVVPIPGSSPMTMPVSSIPTFNPIPMPAIGPLPTPAIPIPGSTPVDAAARAASNQTFPFFLMFDCSVVPEGTLFITAEATGIGIKGTPEMGVVLGL